MRWWRSDAMAEVGCDGGGGVRWWRSDAMAEVGCEGGGGHWPLRRARAGLNPQSLNFPAQFGRGTGCSEAGAAA